MHSVRFCGTPSFGSLHVAAELHPTCNDINAKPNHATALARSKFGAISAILLWLPDLAPPLEGLRLTKVHSSL